MQVTSAYAKIHLPELLKAVEKGETVEITRYNKLVAALVPHTALSKPPAPIFGTAPDSVKVLDPDWAKPMTNDEMKQLINTGSF